MYKEFNVGHDTRSVRVNLKLRIFKPASIELLNVHCICIYIYIYKCVYNCVNSLFKQDHSLWSLETATPEKYLLKSC